ncbi:MAG: DUF2252 domain-containing protein [Thermomicrobiales bacterium]|nr:DUF2252 domain-containing protein [Thermomicrobiales bacterium]
MSSRTQEAQLEEPVPSASLQARQSASGLRPILSVAERRELGRIARGRVPRQDHKKWTPSPTRPDPVELLRAQDADRIPELVPIRYGRMLESPFAFLRGSAVVMADDLATVPYSRIAAQLCGDAHISNFGFYASPERQLIFDINDFDETLPGPWEWDIKRLAASVVVAGRENGHSKAACQAAAYSAVREYQSRMAEYAELTNLEVWYRFPTVEHIFEFLSAREARLLGKTAKKARRKVHHQVARRIAEKDGEMLRIVEDPPLVERLTEQEIETYVQPVFRRYLRSLSDHHRELIDRFQFSDAARRVVGVGSVGTYCYAVALTGRDVNDPLFLQLKQAGPSVLASYLPPSRYANQAQRIVTGQQFVQSASDMFLGWIRLPSGREFYIRQLKDMKGSIEVSRLDARLMEVYATLCGGLLAHAHARTGDPIQISSYIGKNEVFANALTKFAERYADQTERDYAKLKAAVRNGAVEATTGI